MKRWDSNQMLDIGKKLFAKIHKRKYHSHHNNEIHYLAREVDDLRFQDDVLAFCKTKRQLNRCRRRMMEILQERQLSLSRKKSRIGCIEKGFHYLGVDYSPTQTEDYTSKTHANDDSIVESNVVQKLSEYGGG